jgi:hypothetical protein
VIGPRTAIRAIPLWTKVTVDELESTYRGAAGDDAIRRAFARRFTDHRDEF